MYYYYYLIVMGEATLSKMNADGSDVDNKPKRIGRFKNDQDAKKACLAHYNKACKLAEKLGRQTPICRFI